MHSDGFYQSNRIIITAYPIQNSPTSGVEITEIWLENGHTYLSNKVITISPTVNISISISTLTQAIIFYI